MQRLIDYKPLERVVLPDIGQLDCAGLILVIGPNSSGKTQFLRDLEQRIAGEPRELVVAHDIVIHKPDYKPLLECLEREEYIKSIHAQNNPPMFRPQTTYFGASLPNADIQQSQADTWYQSYPDPKATKGVERVLFLNYFGKMFMTALFLDRRLVNPWTIAGFDRNAGPPQGDLHVLYYNDVAQEALWKETTEVFSKAIWLDPTKPGALRLLAADEPFPTDKERRAPAPMDRHRDIGTEGDGLKSYVATCIALLLGRRPVCLIDEPELCLHPPQAYSLGRFIGKFGASRETVTIVATHSSQVLRGIIQTGEPLQIVRLTREATQFHAHCVPSHTLKQSLKKPALRAETILDGLFAQGVAVVEGDGDRTLYQAVYETLGESAPLDIHFAPVAGTGGFFDAVNLYRTLQIPVAVVADLDIISDISHFAAVGTALGGEAKANTLAQEAEVVLAQIKALAPPISAEEVKAQLRELASSEMNWRKGSDALVLRRLQEITSNLNRVRLLKKGIGAMPVDIAEQVSKLVESAQSIGLFLVPVGELENWLASKDIAASKQTKWAWANDAAAQVRVLGHQDDDVWDFVTRIATYLVRNPS